MKIRSSSTEPGHQLDLRAKYEEIYAKSDVWLYKKSHGVHSVIFNQFRELLGKACMLDVGCGAGRLALMSATQGSHVDAFDFSETAIQIAKFNAKACGIGNVSFFIADLETYENPKHYELVTLIGVLEHVQDPIASLARINRLLVDGGTVIVSCPNFLNFRGYTYMTLLTLFELPMSLADLRQVSYMDMLHWCKKTGFELQKSVGAIYRFAWEEKSVEDMIQRVPLAVQDKDLDVHVNYEAYAEWLHSQLDIHRQYLNYLEVYGILKRIQKRVTLHPRRTDDVSTDLWKNMRQYLDEDVKSDPFYCEVEPFCYQGGECIYMLRKIKNVE